MPDLDPHSLTATAPNDGKPRHRLPTTRTIRVLVADDHPLVRDGLVRALTDDGRFAVVGEANDGHQAVTLAEQLRPDLIVLDVRMPGLDGIQAMTEITQQHPDARVVLLSAFDDEVVVKTALAKGAAGYLTKDTDRDVLCDALARAAAGDIVVPANPGHELPRAPAPPELTPRERNVLLLIHDGLHDNMIAYALNIEPEDVGWYIDRVVAKLGAEDRAGAIAAARAWGLIA
jgi:DNA-binding NarL/FixJ family response regulator